MPRNQAIQASHTIALATKVLDLQEYQLRLTVQPRAQYSLVPGSQVAALDLALLAFPLTIRPWQPGDFFYPLGMHQRKKLSDFLVDLKVPVPLKERVYVVTSKGEIVWVMGYRIDDRFKLRDSTQEVYEMRLMN